MRRNQSVLGGGARRGQRGSSPDTGCGTLPSAGLSRLVRPKALKLFVAVLAAGLLCPGRSPRAQFSPPTLVTDGNGTVMDVALGLDLAANAYIVSVSDQKLRIDLLGPSLRWTGELPEAVVGQGEPDLEIDSRGEAFLVFSQVDPDPGETGREIFLSRNGGGQFSVPVNLSNNRVDDFAPQISLDFQGTPHVVWTQALGDTFQVVYYNHTDGSQEVVGAGSYASLYVDPEGTAHVVYARDNDLFYNHNRGGAFENEVRVLETPTEAEFGARIGVTDRGDVLIAYASEGSLYLTSRPPQGGFTAPRLLDGGGVLDPEFRVRSGGILSIVYAKQGEIFFIRGFSSFLLEPTRIGEETPEVESHPSLVVDHEGNLHAAFLRNGDAYYTNNAGEIQAEFSAEPREGEGPLEVRFQDLSSGRVQRWRWDFGDGTQSNLRNPVHVYEEPGKYTVSLTVFSTDRESTEEKIDFIVVQEPFNTLRIPDQAVLPGQRGVWFPVIASHLEPIQGFQLHGVFDPRILTLTEVSQLFTASAGMSPEIWEVNVFEDRFEVGAIFDFRPPFDHTTLPPGDRHVLAYLVFDVANSAPQGGATRIDLVNNFDISRIFNIFTVSGRSRLPGLTGSVVRILPITPPLPQLFVRGDVDGNGSVEITDAIVILTFLFIGGVTPECLDAADVNDTGQIDISSAIGLLNFLFLGGPPPAVPFPHHGVDPTPDTYECVR